MLCPVCQLSWLAPRAPERTESGAFWLGGRRSLVPYVAGLSGSPRGAAGTKGRNEQDTVKQQVLQVTVNYLAGGFVMVVAHEQQSCYM